MIRVMHRELSTYGVVILLKYAVVPVWYKYRPVDIVNVANIVQYCAITVLVVESRYSG